METKPFSRKLYGKVMENVLAGQCNSYDDSRGPQKTPRRIIRIIKQRAGKIKCTTGTGFGKCASWAV